MRAQSQSIPGRHLMPDGSTPNGADRADHLCPSSEPLSIETPVILQKRTSGSKAEVR